MPMLPESSPNTGPASNGTPISATLFDLHPSISSVEAFRAKIYPKLVNVPESAERDQVFGRKCTESFAEFDHASCLWKTFQACFVEGWKPFSETWPKRGMMRNGIVFRPVSLEPHVFEN